MEATCGAGKDGEEWLSVGASMGPQHVLHSKQCQHTFQVNEQQVLGEGNANGKGMEVQRESRGNPMGSNGSRHWECNQQITPLPPAAVHRRAAAAPWHSKGCHCRSVWGRRVEAARSSGRQHWQHYQRGRQGLVADAPRCWPTNSGEKLTSIHSPCCHKPHLNLLEVSEPMLEVERAAAGTTGSRASVMPAKEVEQLQRLAELSAGSCYMRGCAACSTALPGRLPASRALPLAQHIQQLCV